MMASTSSHLRILDEWASDMLTPLGHSQSDNENVFQVRTIGQKLKELAK